MSDYNPSSNINFEGVWLAPNSNLDFGASGSTDTTIYPIGIDSLSTSFPTINYGQEDIKPTGLAPPQFNSPVIRNTSEQLIAKGFESLVANNPTIDNYIKYVKLNSILASAYGSVYLQGGVRFIYQTPVVSTTYGATKVINTTADQAVEVKGFLSGTLSPPSVSPRITYPKGFQATLWGDTAMQRSPMPLGIDHAAYGDTTVWYHTRPLVVGGSESFLSGYPIVFDPAQCIYVQSVIETTLFGDTDAVNKVSFITAVGSDALSMSDYANVESNRRFIDAKKIESSIVGSADISNKTPSIFVGAINDGAISLPSIAYRIQTVKPTGLDSLAIARPFLTKTPALTVAGKDSLSFGAQTVWFKNRRIEQESITASSVGVPTAWFRYRYGSPAGWLSELLPKPTLSHGLREIIGKGYAAELWSRSTRVSYGVQTVGAISIYKDFASNHFVGRHQDIAVLGFEATLWGKRIIPESQTLYPEKFVKNDSVAVVGFYVRHLYAKGFISLGQQDGERWGAAVAYNLRQYIKQEYDENSGLTPPKIDGWTLVEKRNKTIGAIGSNSQRMGYTSIANNATALLPVGIAPTSGEAIPMVAGAIRYLLASGNDSLFMSYWAAVYNDAMVLSPKGFDSQLFAVGASVVTNRRYYGFVGRIDSMVFGAPMVSDAIRTLSVESRYSINPPQIDLPSIDTKTKYVDYTGFSHTGFGSPSLSIHFNIINTRWAHKDYLGEPFVRNVTPELHAFGSDSNEYGRTAIRTQWRIVGANGSLMTQIGLTTIADTTRAVSVSAINSARISDKLVVIKGGAPPYSNQVVSLDTYFDYPSQKYKDGFGIAPPVPLYADRATIYSNNIMALSVDRSGVFGATKVTANSIIVKAGYHEFLVGAGTKIANSATLISFNDRNDVKVDSESVFGKPRMSPHTIYSVIEAPQQAIDNHIKVPMHLVDSISYTGYLELKGVGKPFIESSIRTVSRVGLRDQSWVVPNGVVVSLGLSVISPIGVAAPYLGLPKIPFSAQTITCENKGSADKFGLLGVTSHYYGSQDVLPAGYNASTLPNEHWIALKNRVVSAVGTDLSQLGQSKRYDNPYMWQGLRVGELVPFTIKGSDMLVFGDSTISLRIRDISMTGFDDLRITYDPNKFKDRMTVKRTEYLPESRRITATGSEMTAVGVVGSKHLQHFIKPDGNSDQFRKGGYHA